MADFIFDINTIVQGNHGNKLPITIRNAGSIEGATVRVAIKRGAEVFTKQAVIIDATAGKCEVTLSATDLPTSGLYFYQPTITYADGREFTGEVGRFTVGGKLSGQPPVTIPVGIDLNRLGISVNNRLTIDGVEQIGGTGGGGSVPSNVILFEDWVGGESVTIDTVTTPPPADTTAPVLTISPAGGTFASTQGVTMTTNETADIYYTLDGSTPTTASPKYTAALSLSTTTTLKAFARDTAGNSSAVQTVTFTKDVTAPADTTAPVVTASPAAGTYTSAQSVTLSADETATIYYTTNGTTPTTASNVYSAPINISATTTLQFMAKDTAGNQSVPVAATYTINIPQADTTAPVLTMTAAATFADTQTVNMSANETADIWYTVDGSDPVASGTRVKYTAPVTLTATTTVKAYAVDTAGSASGVQTVTYTKDLTQTTPPAGVATNGLQLYKGGVIANGTTVDEDGSKYFVGNGDWTIAMAVKPSAVSAYLFNIATNPLGANPSTYAPLASDIQNKMIINIEPDGAFQRLAFMTEPANEPDTYYRSGMYSTVKATDTSIFHHVVFTRRGTLFECFVNGVAAGTNSQAFTTRHMNASTRPVIIGDTTKNIQVKNLTIYNRALTTTEIADLSNALK